MFVNRLTVVIRPLTVINLSTCTQIDRAGGWWGGEGWLLQPKAKPIGGNLVAFRKGTRSYPIPVLCLEVLASNTYKYEHKHLVFFLFLKEDGKHFRVERGKSRGGQRVVRGVGLMRSSSEAWAGGALMVRLLGVQEQKIEVRSEWKDGESYFSGAACI